MGPFVELVTLFLLGTFQLMGKPPILGDGLEGSIQVSSASSSLALLALIDAGGEGLMEERSLPSRSESYLRSVATALKELKADIQ